MKEIQRVKEDWQELKARVAQLKQIEAELQALAPPTVFSAEVTSLRAKLKLPHTVEEAEQELEALREKVAQYRQAEALRQAEAAAREAISLAQGVMKEARDFGCTLSQPESLLAQALAAVEKREYSPATEYAHRALQDARAIKAQSRPRLAVELNPRGFRRGEEREAELMVSNQGEAHAWDISVTFSPEMDVAGVNSLPRLAAGSKGVLKVRCAPQEAGHIPLTVTIDYKDIEGKKYTEESIFWLTVKPEEKPFVPPLELPYYILTGRIGAGAFAEVYSAQRKQDGQAVAVKIPKIDAFETFQPKEFLQEAELWSRLKHPYIVSVLEWGVRPISWIAMELMTGGSLKERLKRLSLKESLEIVVKLCEALYYAHHLGVIHRDIKPQNILFDSHNAPKLSDWGLGKVMLEASRSLSGFKGTLAYSAPEQLSSDFGEADWRTDIYQLGAVLYEMLTGQLPCGGEMGWVLTREAAPPRQLNANLPAELDSILLKALARQKEMRYPDVSHLGEELMKVQRRL